MNAITTQQAAAIIGCNVSTVGNHIRRGNLRATLIGRAYALDEDEVKAFAAKFKEGIKRKPRNQIQIHGRAAKRQAMQKTKPEWLKRLHASQERRGVSLYDPIGGE